MPILGICLGLQLLVAGFGSCGRRGRARVPGAGPSKAARPDPGEGPGHRLDTSALGARVTTRPTGCPPRPPSSSSTRSARGGPRGGLLLGSAAYGRRFALRRRAGPATSSGPFHPQESTPPPACGCSPTPPAFLHEVSSRRRRWSLPCHRHPASGQEIRLLQGDYDRERLRADSGRCGTALDRGAGRVNVQQFIDLDGAKARPPQNLGDGARRIHQRSSSCPLPVEQRPARHACLRLGGRGLARQINGSSGATALRDHGGPRTAC